MLIIRNSNKFVKNGQKVIKKWEFYSKMGSERSSNVLCKNFSYSESGHLQ